MVRCWSDKRSVDVVWPVRCPLRFQPFSGHNQAYHALLGLPLAMDAESFWDCDVKFASVARTEDMPCHTPHCNAPAYVDNLPDGYGYFRDEVNDGGRCAAIKRDKLYLVWQAYAHRKDGKSWNGKDNPKMACVKDHLCHTFMPYISRGTGFGKTRAYTLDETMYDLKVIPQGDSSCSPDAFSASIPPRYGYVFEPAVNGGRCRAVAPDKVGKARNGLRAKSKAIANPNAEGAEVFLPLGFMPRGPGAVLHLDIYGGQGANANPTGGHIVPDAFRPLAYSHEFNAPYGARLTSQLHPKARLSGLHSKSAACFLMRPGTKTEGFGDGGWIFFLMGEHDRVISGIRIQGAKFRPAQVINKVHAGCMTDGTKQSQAAMAKELLTQSKPGPLTKPSTDCWWHRDGDEAADPAEMGCIVGRTGR